jgi:hypothetical protein
LLNQVDSVLLLMRCELRYHLRDLALGLGSAAAGALGEDCEAEAAEQPVRLPARL